MTLLERFFVSIGWCDVWLNVFNSIDLSIVLAIVLVTTVFIALTNDAFVFLIFYFMPGSDFLPPTLHHRL